MRKSCYFLFSLLVSLYAYGQEGKLSVEQPVYLEKDTLYGTLLTDFSIHEKIKLSKHPLVIIIPGSGPTDRNGNSAMLPGPNNAYQQLADSLLEEGIASYRYDKPGVGQSSMNKPEENFRFDDNVLAVKAIVQKMKAIGFKKIYLLGHSEGSLTGILATQQTDVNGFISVAGSAENAFDLISAQLENNLDSALKEQTLKKLDSIRHGYPVAQYNVMLASLLRPSVQPYLTSWFAYTPTEEIGDIKKPVLIIQGGRDLQVPKENGEALARAKPDARYLFYPDMNHVLKVVNEGKEQNVASYYDEDFPLQTGLAPDIATWIKAH